MRWLAMFCFSASGAIFALQYGPEWVVLLLAACAVLLAGYGLLRKRVKRLAAFILALGLAFGSCYTALYDFICIQPAQVYENTEQDVCVTVCAYPQNHTYGAKTEVLMEVGGLFPVKAQLYGDEQLMNAKPGDRVMATVKIRSASVIREEKITSFTSKGKHLLLYAKGNFEIEEAGSLQIRYAPLYLNRVLQEKISVIYDGEARVFMTALLTGDRSAFDDTLYTSLSETGVTHVTAVSGMHCAFLFGMVGLLVKSQRYKAVVGIPVLFFFMLMVGATPSVMRACFMLSILSAAPLLHRENDTITTMGVALLLILLQNPYAAASISLQLSFLSILGILLFAKKWYTAMINCILKEGRRGAVVWRFLISAVATTCAASIFTIPLVAYYFECISLVSPLTNLLCLPAVSFAFGMGFFSLLAGVFWLPVAQILAIPAAAALEYFMQIVRLMLQIPYHAVYTSNEFLPYWIVYFYAMITVLLLLKTRRVRTILMTVGLSAATLCLVIALPVLSNGKAAMTVSVLDVGQGESVLLTSGTETALLDCGSANSWINAGAVAANEINTLGRTELTYLILTHYHADHANGLDTLFSRVKVQCLIAPAVEEEENIDLQKEVFALAKRYGTEICVIDAQGMVSLGEACITVYPPLGEGNRNEEGLSLLCSCRNFDMLVTGDMDGKTERSLLEEAVIPGLDVLVVGHHGSKYSTDPMFLEKLQPETGIISVGDNSYGHPAVETLRRMNENNVEVYRTDQNGTVTMRVY